MNVPVEIPYKDKVYVSSPEHSSARHVTHSENVSAVASLFIDQSLNSIFCFSFSAGEAVVICCNSSLDISELKNIMN